jgi:hypothetical protein
MPKSAKLDSTEVTHAVQRAVEAALTAVLQEQQRPKKKTTEPPLPLSEVERQIAKATDDATTPRDRHGFRGTPPPAQFSLAELPDDSLLTEYEVAAVARLSTNTLATWRKRDDHPLKWVKIGGGRVRYRAGALKQFLATGYKPQPGRPRNKDPATAPKPPKRKPKPSGTPTATAKIHTYAAAPERRRAPRRSRAQPAPQEEAT